MAVNIHEVAYSQIKERIKVIEILERNPVVRGRKARISLETAYVMLEAALYRIIVGVDAYDLLWGWEWRTLLEESSNTLLEVIDSIDPDTLLMSNWIDLENLEDVVSQGWVDTTPNKPYLH